MIVDMIINKMGDDQRTEMLMELTDAELTPNNVTRICRQVELTKVRIKKTGRSERSIRCSKAKVPALGHGWY